MKNIEMSKQNVIVIYGPTAVGKSSVAIELAKLINGEIISADSMQIYKGLDIGTAKVTQKQTQGIKHYLIDEKYPTEDYSAAEFVQKANCYIKTILENNKIPIIVGGTGLYIKSLIDGYSFYSTKKDQKLRDELSRLSTSELANKLKELNPEKSFDENNRQRIIRYIEIELNKKEKSDKCLNSPKYNFLLYCLTDDRQKIYDRINSRVDNMVNDGILEELDYLMSLNLPESSLALKAIGYKELIPFYKHQDTLDNCLNILKQKTRNYAKRQLTFMNQFTDKQIVNFENIIITANEIKKDYEKNEK